jgi:hypothetical protein
LAPGRPVDNGECRAERCSCHDNGDRLAAVHGRTEPSLAEGETPQYNDLIGWQLSTLGTTYAVILGFMLYTVWTSLGEADLNVDHEANSVLNIYRLGEGLPEPQRTELQTLALSYVDAVINRDWPQMAKSDAPDQSGGITADMWRHRPPSKPPRTTRCRN